MYLLIKYIKSILWRVAKCLSYIEDAQCLKVKQHFGSSSENPTLGELVCTLSEYSSN